ncbi:hypothetical protein GGI21_006129, partial [Coemansia aciculifera]
RNRLLYHKSNGKLKTKAPNAFMLYRLSVVKSLKGTSRSAHEINNSISGWWRSMSPQEQQKYKTISRKMQSQLNEMNNIKPPQRVGSGSVERIQIVDPDLFHSSISTRVVSSRVSKRDCNSVDVLWGNTLNIDGSSIVSFHLD